MNTYKIRQLKTGKDNKTRNTTEAGSTTMKEASQLQGSRLIDDNKIKDLCLKVNSNLDEAYIRRHSQLKVLQDIGLIKSEDYSKVQKQPYLQQQQEIIEIQENNIASPKSPPNKPFQFEQTLSSKQSKSTLENQYTVQQKMTNTQLQIQTEGIVALNDPKYQSCQQLQLLNYNLEDYYHQNKNKYTLNDTRFNHIKQLSCKNTFLKTQVQDLQLELDQIDEFRIALDRKKPNIQDFQEKRIELLKAQITKQQKHIRKLNQLLQNVRKSYSEVQSICNYIMSAFQKYNSHKQSQDVEQLPSTEQGIIMQLTEKAQQLSLKNLLNTFNNNEERDHFVQNFLSAYNKILDYERDNNEFQKLFALDRNNRMQGNGGKKQKQLKFKHPVKLFLEQYKDHFPIITVFDAFPTQEKETIHNMLTALTNILKKTDKGFKKVQAFSLFNNNPFAFKCKQTNAIELPDLMIDQRDDFENYIKKRDNLKTIWLEYNSLMKCEKTLSTLLENMLNFNKEFALSNKDIVLPDIQNLTQLLRQSIEELLCIGVLIAQDPGVNQAKLVLCHSDMFQVLHSKVKKEDGQASPTAASKIVEVGQVIVDLDLECLKEFSIKIRLIDTLVEDFVRFTNNNDFKMAQSLAQKILYITTQFKMIFEMKSNILLLKDTEIEFLKNQMDLYRQDFEKVKSFLTSFSQDLNKFLQPLHQNILNISAMYEGMYETDKLDDPKCRKLLQITFKKNLKEILENIKVLMLKERDSNVINIKQIESEFENRVKLLTTKWNGVKRKLNKLDQYAK